MIFGGLAAVAAWAIQRDLRIGVARDSIYTFRADENPIGFAAAIAGKAFVVAFGVAQILYALGLGDDPMALLRKIFG
ncbi:MAG: hypothetical protein ABI450_01285 [Rhizomicrobium sp.]